VLGTKTEQMTTRTRHKHQQVGMKPELRSSDHAAHIYTHGFMH